MPSRGHFHISQLLKLWTHLVVFVLLLGGTTAKAAANSTVSDLRFGVGADKKTRIVVELSEKPEYTIALDKSAGKEQVILTLKGTQFAIGGAALDAGTGKGTGAVLGYQYKRNGNNAVIIFGLANPALPQKPFTIDKTASKPVYRLVIDLKSVPSAVFAAALPASAKPKPVEAPKIAEATKAVTPPSPTTPPKTTPPVNKTPEKQPVQVKKPDPIVKTVTAENVPVPRVKPVRKKIKRGQLIVIDAGHGGKDPGSIGKTGLYEKQVTLAAARELRGELSRRGYKVLMTRNNDSYIELEERAIFARDKKADLFISLHADSIKAKNVRGASVYTIDDKGSKRVAAEKLSLGDFEIQGQHVEGIEGQIMLDVVQGLTKEKSAVLAQAIIQELKGLVPMVNNTHRRANLRVLLDPDTPAVMLEMGYMSNPRDEANLKSTRWRRKTMLAVADAIDTYFEQNPSQTEFSAYGSAGGK